MTAITATNSYYTFVFSNYGPLTTTFTQPPKCTSTIDLIGSVDPTDGSIYAQYNAACTYDSPDPYYEGCWPATTPTATLTAPAFTGITEEDFEGYLESQIQYETPYGAYFSPGLYCPSGWETIGMAARDASSALTSSGGLTEYSYDDDMKCPDFIYDCADRGSLMKHALQPGQTMALCCPSGMITNHNGLCISVATDYAVSTGCQGHETYSYEYAKTTYTYTNGSTTGVTVFNSPTATFSDTIPVPTTFEAEERPEYRGLYAVNVLTLLYHESDLEAVATATVNAEFDTTEGDGSSVTTSSAAGSLRRGSVWDGIGSVLVIWIICVGLGAAMILL
ncbi:hypothetical protein BJX62DRAFT_238258 [Aspergillus germanicus]